MGPVAISQWIACTLWLRMAASVWTTEAVCKHSTTMEWKRTGWCGTLRSPMLSRQLNSGNSPLEMLTLHGAEGHATKQEKAFYSILQCISQRNNPQYLSCRINSHPLKRQCLRSVQESYPMLATVLLTKGEDELTLMVVKQALLDKEHWKTGQRR